MTGRHGVRSTAKRDRSARILVAAMQPILSAFELMVPLVARPALAQRGPAARIEEQGWFLRGQMTNFAQGHPSCRARYSGANRLGPRRDGVMMQPVDLVIGRRPWRNAEAVAVP